jgi:AcrR family transcriptional regulator
MTTASSDQRTRKAATAAAKKKATRAVGAAPASQASQTGHAATAAAMPELAAAAPLAARRPGRPTGSARGPEQRARLLDAALTLFARQGIVDTTLGAIAREAGFTPAMVHYYFKTRDQLLDVLIDERFLPLRAAIGGVFEANPDDPVAAITQLARGMVAVAVENPWFPPLRVREVIRIEQWQKEGRVNAELEPSLVFLTLLGLTILPLATSKMWRNDPVRRSLTPDDIARHAVALLVHGLAPQRETR